MALLYIHISKKLSKSNSSNASECPRTFHGIFLTHKSFFPTGITILMNQQAFCVTLLQLKLASGKNSDLWSVGPQARPFWRSVAILHPEVDSKDLSYKKKGNQFHVSIKIGGHKEIEITKVSCTIVLENRS